MYPSSNNNATFFGNYYNDNAPSSSSFHLQSPNYIPLEDEAIFFEFFQLQQFVSNDQNHDNKFTLEHDMPNMESTIEAYSNNNELIATNDGDDDHCNFNTPMDPENSSPTKTVSKKDRHSKINTARGPRDRRMRLSLDVAKKLFGLQDLLGFDKASKTVDWLLTKSKTAILELLPDQSGSFMDVSNSASSTSECEVMSGTADGFMVMTGDDQATNKAKSSSCGNSKKQKEKVTKARKCTDFHHPLAKASRERARERARERTIEKRNNHDVLGQDSRFRACLDHHAMDQDNQHQRIGQLSSDFQFNQGFVSDYSSLMMTGNWTPSYGFNHPYGPDITHEHQFHDRQMNVKAWEGYNN